jgi:phosphoglycolate phosphatase-like HAD superfamily hydrolase
MGLPTRRRHTRTGLLEQVSAEIGWSLLTEGVAAPPDFAPGLDGGSLVFDIDGVLLDTHKSFREVIPQSVNFFLEVVLREDSEAPLMRADDVHAYKSAGGFNNDWDVAEAGLIHALWWSRLPETALSLASFTERIGRHGGGLPAARHVLRDGIGDREADRIIADVDRDGLERIFKELYVGGDRFREVFGEEPRFYRGTGGMEREVPLAEGPLWQRATGRPFGILTGRIPAEARLAVERLGIDGVLSPARLVTDDGTFPTKPDPAGLMHLAGELPGRPLFYFGDNRDDLNALVAARGRLDADMHFVYCLSGSTDAETVRWFAEHGTTLMAVEVTDALAVLLD